MSLVYTQVRSSRLLQLFVRRTVSERRVGGQQRVFFRRRTAGGPCGAGKAAQAVPGTRVYRTGAEFRIQRNGGDCRCRNVQTKKARGILTWTERKNTEVCEVCMCSILRVLSLHWDIHMYATQAGTCTRAYVRRDHKPERPHSRDIADCSPHGSVSRIVFACVHGLFGQCRKRSSGNSRPQTFTPSGQGDAWGTRDSAQDLFLCSLAELPDCTYELTAPLHLSRATLQTSSSPIAASLHLLPFS